MDVNFIMAYESGELDSEDELIEGFQALIDSGAVWQLQGHYGRTAVALIDAGHCTDQNRYAVPARHVKPELVGTFCECGASYDAERGGYRCAS